MNHFYKTYFHTTANLQEVEKDSILTCEGNLCTASRQKGLGGIPIIKELENQRDLMKITSVLLSIGINRNDDVFIPEEVLPVRNTGAHKPLNIEHDPNQIVGHMIRTFAALKDGTIVKDNAMPSAKEFDILSESVLYKFLFSDLADSVEDKALANKLFVSVEVWFTDFDFLVGNKIVKRNQQTASILDGRLRINGGSGEFEGQRLGRVLRNMIIGGIGLVKHPANPESVIKSVAGLNSEDVQDIEDNVVSKNIIEDIDNSLNKSISSSEENMRKEIIEEYTQVLAAIRAAETVPEQVEVEEAGEVEQSESSVSEDGENTLEAGIIDLKDDPAMQALLARLTSLEKDNKELKDKADDSALKEEMTRRLQVLNSVSFNDNKISDEVIEKAMSRLIFMNEDEFDGYVGMLVDVLKDLTKATASEDKEVKEDQDTEGGELSKSTDVVTEEVEVTEDITVSDDTEITVENEDVIDNVSENTEDEADDYETVDLTDIEPVDQEITVETDDKEESLAEKYGKIFKKFNIKV